MMIGLRHLVAATLLAGASVGALAAGYELRGTVVHVDDGDTVVLLAAPHLQHKIRLASIDAPESSHTNRERGRIGQPFANASRDYLASMVKGKDVVAQCYERDKYERDVCEIFVGSVSANRQMVRAGMAWANMAAAGQYLRDRSLLDLESDARQRGIGLWADAHPVAPWVWRDQCWKGALCRMTAIRR